MNGSDSPGAGAWMVAFASLVVLIAGCGGSRARARTRVRCPTCPARIAQARVDVYARVLTRIYRQEVHGTLNGSAFVRIARLPGLRRGLSSGDYALAARTLAGPTVLAHAVRERVTRGGRVLLDSGRLFSIGGVPRPLRGVSGGDLLEVSIQSVPDFIRLVRRLTGAQVVMRGSVAGHAASSLGPAALAAALPMSGRALVNARGYTVSSVRLVGFGGEQLEARILVPG